MVRKFYRAQLITGIIVLSVLGFGTAGRAKTMYVTDSFQITFRSGKGTDFKILQMLTSGTPVKIIQEEGEWTQVELENGQRGWTLTRYLMDGPPNSILVERLNRQLENQQSRLSKTVEENTALKNSNQELRTQVDSLKKDWETAHNNYEKLVADSSEFLDVKKNYESLKADHDSLTQRIQELQIENDELRISTKIYWFLAGALVLLIGLIVGISMGRMQRKKKLMY